MIFVMLSIFQIIALHYLPAVDSLHHGQILFICLKIRIRLCVHICAVSKCRSFRKHQSAHNREDVEFQHPIGMDNTVLYK